MKEKLLNKIDIVIKYIPIILIVGSIMAFLVKFLTDVPVFQQPKYSYVNRKTFMEYLEAGEVYYLPGIYECITNESNELINRSLIEMVEIKLNSGVAIDTMVQFDIYNSSGYTEEGFCFLTTIVPANPTSYEKINLKTFDVDRKIYIPLSITAPLFSAESKNKVFSSEELKNMDKILIQYKPRYIEYRNGKWQRIPLLGNTTYKTTFEGMQISRPIQRK